MNAIKLTGTKPDGAKVYIWACSKCGYTAGDAVNFIMMLADNCGALEVTK